MLDVADDPVFVYDEGGATTDEPLFVEDAIGSNYLSLDVAEQGESHPNVFLESLVGGVAIHTDADDLRVGLLEVGNISLIRL